MSGTWEVTTSLSSRERLDVLAWITYLETHLGREAIDEARRRAVVHATPAQHWLRYVEGHLAGYAMVSGEREPSIEMAGGAFDAALLARVLELYPQIDWWTRGPQERDDGRDLRTLQFLRVDLPVALEPVPEGATLRTFDPARDEVAWLEQNNAAFADHPEQGAWHLGDLDARTREPWFDPSGFLVLEIEGRLAASCWTKVHELYEERFGEIYVVSVDPAFQGRRLGRVMVTQGLETLRRRGVARAGLFVDESNTNARALYDSLGFELVREDHLTRFSRA
jgi:ribosomal protein S18 acetylase RimI-like enzyme